MTIANEMDAALIALALATARARTRPDSADIVAQLDAVAQHFEELRGAVQALETLMAQPRLPAEVVDLAARRARLRPIVTEAPR